ncbi:MAG: 23S rRNA (uracil(1939)-C(5))-methyltransferase RlmD [Clostridia bacterium]|nr:23S rRNA (uracil(1939)-C(5))-methyltransferase RlmD [Clostridia bacterium]
MDDIRLKQDDILELTIADDGMAGEGVSRVGTYTVFVPFCLKGEKVRAKVTHVRKDGVVFTELKEVLSPSPLRVKPPCNRFTRCGGCDLMHVEYARQTEIKRENVERLFQKNTRLDVEVQPTVPCTSPYAYRNKIQLPFGTVEGRTVLGFYRENSHRVVSITKCFLHGDWVEKLISIFLDYADTFRLSAYNETTGKGDLKHLVARYIDGNLAVVLVTAGRRLPGLDYVPERLKKDFGSFSFYLSDKPEKNNVVMGKSIRPVVETPFVVDILGIKAGINPYSFLQLNAEIRDKIYTAVLEDVFARSDAPIVVDAYAGVGILGAVAAKRGAKVYNIEIVKEAVEDGKALAAKNGVKDRVHFVCGDAAEELPKLISELSDSENFDFGSLNIILDPPRKGCDERVLAALNGLSVPHKLYYISCNPATLTRDLNRLIGYDVLSVTPYDMFCQTRHVETLVRLSRRDINY